MKKIKLLLLFISLLILPSISYALDSNNKNIYIDSVDVIEKSNNTEILNPASFNGLTINSDIKFLEKNDYIIYKVIIKNNSTKSYKINNNIKSSEYIKYDCSFDNNNNIVKAKSKLTMKITVTYQKEVPQNMMNDDGTFTETKNMVINLAQGNSIINNPNTSSTIIFLLMFITVIVCIVSIIGIRKHNNVKALLIIFGVSFLSLPLSIMAIESLQIQINSKVTIESPDEFCVYDQGLTMDQNTVEPTDNTYSSYLAFSYKYKYKKGMTIQDFINSEYYNQVGNETPLDMEIFNSIDYPGISNLKRYITHDLNGNIILLNLNSEEETIDDVSNHQLKPCEEGIYQFLIK